MADTPDYRAAYRILSNQLKLYPGDAELHYFMGYTIDRMNAFDGKTMALVKRERTLEASEHFEMVNTLSPTYSGEYLILDPYAKISSIWGSLAQAYLTRSLPDSALWAFREGKRRGGFTEAILHFNRQLLGSCTKNAILITNGDNITIPIWYLQEVEHYRTDITIVDANLLNTAWYPKYLKHDKKLDISFTDSEIDSVDYVTFKKRYMTISNPNDPAEKFSWELKPTYYGAYILKADRMLLNILKQNLFERDIYFNANSDSTWNLFLDRYLADEGLVGKLKLKGINPSTDTLSANLVGYNIDNLDAKAIKRSRDAILLLNNYRWAYYAVIAGSLSRNKKKRAKQLREELEIKFPESKLPYPDKAVADYFKRLFSKID